MIFTATKIPGAYLVDLEKLEDERGFFARRWCERVFAEQGLTPRLAQCNISFNHSKGTLRGMHFQAKPFEEAKLVRCISGAIFDVAVDIRPQSPAFRQWVGLELSAENRSALYLPEGCAHGFLTLTDRSEILYQMSEFYDPDSGRGFRWDDPEIGIEWPGEVEVISERDRSLPELRTLLA
jgi:dTDP-4-dehydrorhamnose 3,5-epimerase